jgi:hypothetical protein
MANEDATANGSVATLDREESAVAPAVFVIEPSDGLEVAPKTEVKEKKRKKKDGDDSDLERELEFVTPFGKLELEFEPTEKKQKKDRERREKTEREAAKAAERAQRKLAKQAEKSARGRGGGSRLLLILLVIGLIGAAIAIAWWLFARPSEELEQVPEELRVQPEPEPHGAVARFRDRIRHAVREGQRASAETQREQLRRFEDATGRR